jgi:hypothetical protein
MKKPLLFILAVFYAQCFLSQNVLSSASLTITSYAPTVSGLVSNFQVTERIGLLNHTASSVKVMFHRYDLDTVPGTVNSVCLGPTCYPSSANIATAPYAIAAHDTDNTFYGDYDPQAIAGVSHIRYTIYNQFNQNDSVSVLITFMIQPTGIAPSPLMGVNKISPAFPNPASASTAFNYTLQNDAASASLVIYDMLGAVVEKVNLANRQSPVILPADALNSGIYFCSFLVEGKLLGTQKLIVSH